MVVAAGDNRLKGNNMEELEFDDFLASTDEYMSWRSEQPQDESGVLIGSYDFSSDSMVPQQDENEDVGGVSLLSNLGFPMNQEDGGLLADMIGKPDQPLAATKDDDMAINLASAAQASSGGDKGATDYLKLMASKMGDKTIAALIQAGFGMLQGASQGQMLQKKWDREDQVRNEEIARRAAYAKPGQVSQMQWSPSNPAGKGLLGAKVG